MEGKIQKRGAQEGARREGGRRKKKFHTAPTKIIKFNFLSLLRVIYYTFTLLISKVTAYTHMNLKCQAS